MTPKTAVKPVPEACVLNRPPQPTRDVGALPTPDGPHWTAGQILIALKPARLGAAP
jgi:hypothetical protein